MPDGIGVLHALSGQRANKKQEVFYEMKRQMQEQFPHLPVIFMDDIVSKKPLPIYWCEAQRALDPKTRLILGLAELHEAVVKKIRPAIMAGKIVVTLRYGLDVFLDSIAETDCPQARKNAHELWHNHLVPQLIIRDLPKPQYFIPQMRPADANVLDFNSRQATDVREYFGGTGQRQPIYLTDQTVEGCAAEAIHHILSATAQNRIFAT